LENLIVFAKTVHSERNNCSFITQLLSLKTTNKFQYMCVDMRRNILA